MRYNGQKLINEVSTKIPDTTIKTIPNVPVMMCVKKRVAITAAMITRITLSAIPMFDFIV